MKRTLFFLLLATFTNCKAQEIQKPKQQPIRVEQKIGRNDPCPCGSGKKYKSCHGVGVA